MEEEREGRKKSNFVARPSPLPLMRSELLLWRRSKIDSGQARGIGSKGELGMGRGNSLGSGVLPPSFSPHSPLSLSSPLLLSFPPKMRAVVNLITPCLSPCAPYLSLWVGGMDVSINPFYDSPLIPLSPDSSAGGLSSQFCGCLYLALDPFC